MSETTPLYLTGCRKMTLPCPRRWTLQGYSKAGRATGFVIPELKIVLDAGLGYEGNPKSIFVTHSHVDHAWNFPLVNKIRLDKPAGCEHLQGCPTYAPQITAPLLELLQSTCEDLSLGAGVGAGRLVKAKNYHLFPVTAGETYREEGLPALKDLEVEILPCYHTTQTVAFGFSARSLKLKPEYRSLSGKEIKELRQSGAEIRSWESQPQLVFFGDTNIKALTDHLEWTKYPVVIIECTQMPEMKATPLEIAERGHIHFQSILPIIKKHPDTYFVLIHTSMAVRDTDLLEFQEMVYEVHETTNFCFWTQLESLPKKEIEES